VSLKLDDVLLLAVKHRFGACHVIFLPCWQLAFAYYGVCFIIMSANRSLCLVNVDSLSLSPVSVSLMLWWRRIATPGKLNVKTGSHIAYISVLVFFWFSVGCCFYCVFRSIFRWYRVLSIAIHIRILHHFSSFYWVLAVAHGPLSTKFPPWLKPLVTPLLAYCEKLVMIIDSM